MTIRVRINIKNGYKITIGGGIKSIMNILPPHAFVDRVLLGLWHRLATTCSGIMVLENIAALELFLLFSKVL